MRGSPALVLLGLVLAGCLAPASPEEPSPQGAAESVVVARDAAGDATDANAELATRPAAKCAPLGPPAAGACAGLDDALRGRVGPEAGVPGPAALDVLEAAFQETPELLRVRVTIASLGADFADAVQPERRRGATWGVCWGDPEEGRQCASLAAAPAGSGVAREATFTWWSGQCNDWWYCSWAVAHELAFGTPAVLTLDVPRAVLPQGGAGGALLQPRIVSERIEFPPDRPSWALRGPLAGGGAVEQPWMRHHADLSPFGDPFTFTTPRAQPPRQDGLAHAGPAALAEVAAELDLQHLALAEDDAALLFAVTLARVDETPGDHDLALVLGTPSGRVVEAGYVARDGTRRPYATMCADADCREVVEPPFTFDLHAGSPGRAVFAFARSGLGSPAAGEALTLVAATTARHDRGAASPEAPAGAAFAAGYAGDASGVAPPFWFQRGPAP